MGADHDDNNTPDNTSATSSTPGRGDALARRLKQIERDEVEAETMEERLGREGAAGLGAVVREWVWVSMLGIYMNRADPSIALKKETFNDKFRCYAPKGCSVSNLLHSRRKDTILKPDRVVYRPNRGEFLKAGREWNLWRPSEIVAAPGDTTLWDRHLAYLFPDQKQRDHLLDWLAGVLQRLGVKPLHALLLLGVYHGTGKSWVLRVLAKLIGDSNWRPLTQDILASGFTGWAMRTKLVIVEELRTVSKSELANKLHPWITQPEMSVNEKNLPSFTLEQVIAFAFMSNRLDAMTSAFGDAGVLGVLQRIAHDADLAPELRVKVAAAAAPYERPKLQVQAKTTVVNLYDVLERARQRDREKVIEHQPEAPDPAA